ncbi:MAG TPA: hypothetical protein VF402_07405, partial [Asticcacaulis sp.]
QACVGHWNFAQRRRAPVLSHARLIRDMSAAAFAEFERTLIRERTLTGPRRPRASQICVGKRAPRRIFRIASAVRPWSQRYNK